MKHKYLGDHETVQDFAQKPAKQTEQDLCRMCDREPSKVNNAVSECSHVDCPHRRGVQSLDGFTRVKTPRVGVNPRSRHQIGDGWGSGCYKKQPKFEE